MINIAKALIPDKVSGDPFWTQLAQACIVGIWLSANDIYYNAPLLSTICQVLRMPSVIQKTETLSDGKEKRTPEDFLITFLKHCKDNKRLVEILESGESVRTGVMAELMAALNRFSAAAGHDARVKKRLSMSDFVHRTAEVNGKPVRVVVCNMDIRTRKAAESYMRVAYRLFVNNILASPDVIEDPNHAKTFVYIDEAPFVSSTGLPGFQEKLNVSRSKAVHCLMIAQSVTQIYQCYGKEDGESILAGLPNKIYTASGSSANAEFAEKTAGKVYVSETKFTRSEGDRGVTHGESESRELRHIHATGELLTLPFPTKERGLYFYQIDPDFKGVGGPIKGHWSGDFVAEMKPPKNKSIPGLDPRPNLSIILCQTLATLNGSI